MGRFSPLTDGASRFESPSADPGAEPVVADGAARASAEASGATELRSGPMGCGAASSKSVPWNSSFATAASPAAAAAGFFFCA